MNKVSVTILVRDSEAVIGSCLDCLTAFDEVVVLDNGSTDRTMEIVRRYPNVSLITHEFTGFGDLKNRAAEAARNDWIFSVDSDEFVDATMAGDVLERRLDGRTTYRMRRRNHLNGVRIRGGGWGRDTKVRLYNRTVTRFDDRLVHEKVIVRDGMHVDTLKGYADHYGFHSTGHLIDKMQQYTELSADQAAGRKRTGPMRATLHAFWAFVRTYMFKAGFVDGGYGWLIAINSANIVFYKHMKIWEKNRNRRHGGSFIERLSRGEKPEE